MIHRSCETSAELREALHAKVEADFKEVSVDPSRTPSFTGPSAAPEKVGSAVPRLLRFKDKTSLAVGPWPHCSLLALRVRAVQPLSCGPPVGEARW